MDDTPDLSSPSNKGRRRRNRPSSQKRKRNRSRKNKSPQEFSGETKDEDSELPQRNLNNELADEVLEEVPEAEHSPQGDPSVDTPPLPTPQARNPTVSTRQQTQAPIMPANQIQQVTLGGVTLQIKATPATDQAGSLQTMKKETRKNLDDAKRHDLFEGITKHQHTSFDLQAQTIASVKDLQENYDLGPCLSTLELHFKQYDVLDIFYIVFPKKDINGAQTGELETTSTGDGKRIHLLDRYNELTLDDVAESSKWYFRWPDETLAPWYRENLNLSYAYLSNHMTPALWGKVLEDLLPYKHTQAIGGPLTFFAMMRRLQSNSQLVIETIQHQLKTLRIDQYPGESVDDLVSHVRSMLIRLKTLERTDSHGDHISNLPKDINKTLVQLFQTSSDSEFNAIFRTEQLNKWREYSVKGDAAYGSPDDILDMASIAYRDRLSSVEGWTGQFHKVNETGFSASADNPCFNCGAPGCQLKTCPEPMNEERIKKNKTTFFDARRAAKDKNKDKDKKGKSPKGGKSKPKAKAVQFEHLRDPTVRNKIRLRWVPNGTFIILRTKVGALAMTNLMPRIYPMPCLLSSRHPNSHQSKLRHLLLVMPVPCQP